LFLIIYAAGQAALEAAVACCDSWYGDNKHGGSNDDDRGDDMNDDSSGDDKVGDNGHIHAH
jgi:hypothetical protein